MRTQQIGIPEMCDVCGENPVTLFTKADQSAKPEHCSFWADDQDEVRCPECGAKGLVTVEDQIASIVWSEEDAN